MYKLSLFLVFLGTLLAGFIAINATFNLYFVPVHIALLTSLIGLLVIIVGAAVEESYRDACC